jgi:hypothetical protein
VEARVSDVAMQGMSTQSFNPRAKKLLEGKNCLKEEIENSKSGGMGMRGSKCLEDGVQALEKGVYIETLFFKFLQS